MNLIEKATERKLFIITDSLDMRTYKEVKRCRTYQEAKMYVEENCPVGQSWYVFREKLMPYAEHEQLEERVTANCHKCHRPFKKGEKAYGVVYHGVLLKTCEKCHA